MQRAQEIWLNKECAEIEKYKNNESVAMYKKIKEISGHNICSFSGCIKSKTGNVIMEKEQVLRRWTEYIGELFHDKRGEKPKIKKYRRTPYTKI